MRHTTRKILTEFKSGREERRERRKQKRESKINTSGINH